MAWRPRVRAPRVSDHCLRILSVERPTRRPSSGPSPQPPPSACAIAHCGVGTWSGEPASGLRGSQTLNALIGTRVAGIAPKDAFPEVARHHQLEEVDALRQPIRPVQYRYEDGALTRRYKEGMMLRQVGTVTTAWRDGTRLQRALRTEKARVISSHLSGATRSSWRGGTVAVRQRLWS